MAIQKTFALILGIVLLLAGILGFFENSFIGDSGFFGTNTLQDVLHLIAGAFGVYIGTKGQGSKYNATIGWIGLVLGVLGFVPVAADLIFSLLNINQATSILHLAIGVIALLVYYAASK